MTVKKFTDEEIKKALESLAAYDCTRCLDLGHDCFGKDCDKAIAENALDLINRQQAEIERLQKDSNDIDNFARNICKERLLQGKAIADFDSLQKYVKSQRAEAIKEFAERLKEKPIKYGLPLFGLQTKSEIEEHFDDIMMQVRNAIDNLVKEMFRVNCW